MAFFKKFGGGGKKSKGKDVFVTSEDSGVTEVYSSKHRQQQQTHQTPVRATQDINMSAKTGKQQQLQQQPLRQQQQQQQQQQHDDEEHDFDLPASFKGGRKDRNMSISRSGRHKFRNKQRGSVLKDEVYGESVSSTSSASPTSPTSPAHFIPPTSKNNSLTSNARSSSSSTPAHSAASGSGSGSQTTTSHPQRGSLGRAGAACRESDSSSRRLSNEHRVVRQTAV